MTTQTRPAASRPTTHRPDRSGRLRLALGSNAALSIVSGLAMALIPERIADVLDTGHPGWIRAVGIAVALFGADVAIIARRPTAQLRRFAPAVIVADVGWVIASIATIGLGWYSAGGDIAVALMAALVGACAVAQFSGWRRVR